MGQNQEKPEGGEQALSEGSETRPCPDSGGAGSHTGDVMEGGSSQEEETGNTGENSGEADTQDLDGSPGHEPTLPSSEKHVNLRESPFAAREVRQGGAAGKEGGGGDGGKTVPVVPQETDKNQKSSARIEERATAYKLFNQIKREERKAEEKLRTSSNIKMEYQDEGTSPHEDKQDENFSAGGSHEKYGLVVTSEDANCLDNTEEGSVVMKIRRRGDHTGDELLSTQDQNETMMAESEDIKLCAGTVGCLSERKEPPPAQPQHPLKNNLQKESLLDMSDTIHCRRPKERTENNTKEEILTCEVTPVLNDHSSRKPKVTDADDQRESVRPYLQMDTAGTNTSEKTDSDSGSNPVSAVEPSSILEKLLKRNRKEATPVLSKVKEVDFDNKDNMDVPVKMNAKKMPVSAATDIPRDRIDQSECDVRGILPSSADSKRKTNLAAKDHHIKDLDVKQTDTADSVASDGLCSQPGVIGNIVCDSALAKSHYSKADRQSSEKNINPTDASSDMCPSKNLSSDNLQSAGSHERMSCEVSGVISKASAPSPVSDAKPPPTKSDGQVAESCHLLTAEKTDASTVRLPLKTKRDNESKINSRLSGSERENTQSEREKEVNNSSEDTATPAVDACSVLVAGGTAIPEVTTSMKQDLHMTPNTDQLDKKPGKERDDSVSLRDKSQSTPKSRPVSELIKETIQLHEKLQHQDRPKPAEVKADEQGQSVKVAQMKAAFDSAKKSPDKAIERKPSVRKGKDI
ncbi:uncharacterized protein LOC111660273 [Seriola lalandi dorsalis]|uniref:uncharacterized protein LOC111660273 n=1 Tax=Seriola lalandi dorsalis TaxID=1841481 RepID=UPI000C6F5865|nr:uncharacterized protein LOC111660273 [Seriola lalandi dorsalis]